MKKTFFGVFLSFITLLGCSKDPQPSDAKHVINVHFGSYHNSLSGVAIQWRNNSSADSIIWGYSPQFEKGKFPARKSDNYKN